MLASVRKHGWVLSASGGVCACGVISVQITMDNLCSFVCVCVCVCVCVYVCMRACERVCGKGQCMLLCVERLECVDERCEWVIVMCSKNESVRMYVCACATG